MDLRNAVAAAFSLDLPATAAFDYPTASALAAHIAAQLVPRHQPSRQQDLRGAVHPQAVTEVVGMACVYPGSQAGVEGFWGALAEGHTLQRPVLLERWDVDAFFNPEAGVLGSAYTRFGAFAEDVDLFDADHFRLSRAEAASIDPQTRLLLQVGLFTPFWSCGPGSQWHKTNSPHACCAGVRRGIGAVRWGTEEHRDLCRLHVCGLHGPAAPGIWLRQHQRGAPAHAD